MPLHMRNEIEAKALRELRFGKANDHGIMRSDILQDGNRAIHLLKLIDEESKEARQASFVT